MPGVRDWMTNEIMNQFAKSAAGLYPQTMGRWNLKRVWRIRPAWTSKTREDEP